MGSGVTLRVEIKGYTGAVEVPPGSWTDFQAPALVRPLALPLAPAPPLTRSLTPRGYITSEVTHGRRAAGPQSEVLHGQVGGRLDHFVVRPDVQVLLPDAHGQDRRPFVHEGLHQVALIVLQQFGVHNQLPVTDLTVICNLDLEVAPQELHLLVQLLLHLFAQLRVAGIIPGLRRFLSRRRLFISFLAFAFGNLSGLAGLLQLLDPLLELRLHLLDRLLQLGLSLFLLGLELGVILLLEFRELRLDHPI
mmetsp:Transcript_115674/g.201332  ORF Transcript_115674/g.201332 Transcript_115674/m.201332 type:complete len:249 (+) Transcript_115674:467-1213(+)